MAIPNQDPIFISAPNAANGIPQNVSAANTGRDGTGTIVDLATAGTNGTRVEGCTVKAIVTTTLGMIRFFVKHSSTYYLLDEVVVTAISVSAGVAGFSKAWRPPVYPLILPSGAILAASTHNAEAFVLTPSAFDYIAPS